MGFGALFAEKMGAIAFGQQKGGSLGTGIGFPVPKTALQDPLYKITRTMFTDALNTKFSALKGGVYVGDLVLVKVEARAPAFAKIDGNAIRDCFALTFQGGARSAQLPQSTYQLWSPKLGSFQLFLVPGDTSSRLGPMHTALINRLYP